MTALYLRKAVPSPKGTWEARDFSRERLHFHRNCSRNRKEDSAVGEYDDYL